MRIHRHSLGLARTFFEGKRRNSDCKGRLIERGNFLFQSLSLSRRRERMLVSYLISYSYLEIGFKAFLECKLTIFLILICLYWLWTWIYLMVFNLM